MKLTRLCPHAPVAALLPARDGQVTGFPELFPGISNRVLTLNLVCSIPFFREWIMLNGILSVSKSSINTLLGSKAPHACNAVTIVVGGAQEALGKFGQSAR